MNDRGVLYQNIIYCVNFAKDSIFYESINDIKDPKIIKKMIEAGARYIRKQLERFNIYFEPGTTLEDIVFNSLTPHRDLEKIIQLVHSRVGVAQMAEISYGAIVAVYLAAHNNREEVVPLKTLLKYYPYVKPILLALAIHANYDQIIEKYDQATSFGHL